MHYNTWGLLCTVHATAKDKSKDTHTHTHTHIHTQKKKKKKKAFYGLRMYMCSLHTYHSCGAGSRLYELSFQKNPSPG